MTEKIKCPFCGAEIDEDSNYCEKCNNWIVPDEIDDIDTYQRWSMILYNLFLLVILWMMIFLVLGVICKLGNIHDGFIVILSLALTILIYLVSTWKQ